MRKIKFRAWDEQDKKMVFEFQNSNKCKPYLDNEGLLVRSTWHTLMQYTGLKDKNGKEVYEGDILAVKDAIKQAGVFEVVWNEGAFNFRWSLKQRTLEPIYTPEYLEIIGNIYENPELLK